MRPRTGLLLLGALVLGAGSIMAVGAAGGRASTARPKQPSQTDAKGTALVEAAEHDFGLLDLSDPCAHEFTIRNVGQGPLRLRPGGTSCKCTISELSTRVVEPGGSCQVRVELKPGSKPGPFVQSATVRTEDPDHPALRFQIRGILRRIVDADPPEAVFQSLRRGHEASLETVIYSQVWESFEGAGVQTSRPEIRYGLAPADPETLARLKATAGYRVTVTAGADLPAGAFFEWLQLRLRPPEPHGKGREFSLSVRGEVPSAIALWGAKTDAFGVVRLGTLRAGEASRERLTLKVHDSHRELQIGRIAAEPPFLRVEVTPYAEKARGLGLYRIDVEVPPDAPAGNYIGPGAGEIRIQTDHPLVPTVKLQVEFAVASAEEMGP